MTDGGAVTKNALKALGVTAGGDVTPTEDDAALAVDYDDYACAPHADSFQK